MTLLTSRADQRPISITSDDAVIATTIPVDPATTTYRTLLRLVVERTGGLTAGDLLDIEARARVTSELAYPVGVGYHLWAYDVDSALGSSGPWWRIGSPNGDNVFQPRHHMPLHISALYQVPDDWPAGHRITVVFRGDAHSTAARPGHRITVDQGYGQLIVRRWTTAPPAAGDQGGAISARDRGPQSEGRRPRCEVSRWPPRRRRHCRCWSA